jgi:hypothetical protein
VRLGHGRFSIPDRSGEAAHDLSTPPLLAAAAVTVCENYRSSRTSPYPSSCRVAAELGPSELAIALEPAQPLRLRSVG